MVSELMTEVDGPVKRYGDTVAPAMVSFVVPAGTVLGALPGPNGAGRTTAVRVLTTLTALDQGHARIAGFDAIIEAWSVKRLNGVVAQDATLDEVDTGTRRPPPDHDVSRMPMLNMTHLTRLQLSRRCEPTDALDARAQSW